MQYSAFVALFFSFSKQSLTYDVTTPVQSLWTRGRQCTSRSLTSVYSVETLHVGLTWPRLGPIFRVTVSLPTCKQGCTGDGTTYLFGCCGLAGVVCGLACNIILLPPNKFTHMSYPKKYGISFVNSLTANENQRILFA